MTEEKITTEDSPSLHESVIESPEKNPKKDDSMKGILIALSILLIGAIGLGVYFFNFVEKKTNYDSPDVKELNLSGEPSGENQESSMEIKDSYVAEKDFSSKANFKFNLEIPEEKNMLNVNMKDMEFTSSENGLKSRLKIGNFLMNIQENLSNTNIEIKDLDIITDEDITYMRMEGEDVKNMLLQDPELSGNFSELIKNIFSGNYVKMDNSKKIIEAIGTNDEVIISFIKGMMSPNSKQYFEKYGINEKMRKKFLSKNSYKIIFEETSQEEGKIYVKIKDEACDVARNISNKMAEETGETINFDQQQCLMGLKNINKLIGDSVYITQEGDKETISYNGNIQFELSYANGEVVNLNISTFLGTIKYKEKHLSVNLTSGMMGAQFGVNASLKIEQDFEGDKKGSLVIKFDSNGQEFNFDSKYSSSSLVRETNGNLGDIRSSLKFQGQGDQDKGSFSFQAMENNQELGRLTYIYETGSHKLSIETDEFKLQGQLKYKGKNIEFIILLQEGEEQFKLQGKTNYIDEKLDSALLSINLASKETDVNTKIEYRDSNLDGKSTIINKAMSGDTIEITMEGPLSEDNIDIKLSGQIGWTPILEGTIKGDKESLNVNMEIPTEMVVIKLNNQFGKEENKQSIKGDFNATQSGVTKVKADWEFDYNEENVEYIIPNNAREIDTPMFSRFQIPNFNLFPEK